jgi:uncharacterized membrane protein
MKVLCADHVDVAVPVESVFSFVTDISRWPVWISSVVCAEHAESLPVALDEEFLLCLHAGRKRWHEKFEVTRFVPGAFLSLEGEFSSARRIDFRFEQRGAVTRVACAFGYPLFGGFVSKLMDRTFKRPRLRREVKDSLARLKGLLEERVESTAVGEGLYDETPFGSMPAAVVAPAREPARAT